MNPCIKLITFLFFSVLTIVNAQTEYRKNMPITMDFEIEQTDETSEENPFTDYRLQVEFQLDNDRYSVPGFFAADGNAAQTGAFSGGIWRVIFVPNKTGNWKYTVSFKKGAMIALNEDMYEGKPISEHHGKSGTLTVLPPQKEATGFHSSGRLQYTGSRYLYTEDGNPFLKFGSNSPENFLAYADIDSTYSYDPEKKFVKSWEPHVRDWKPGDPTWKNGKGKGIIGALNYLASKGMNAVYALTLNIEGDARDVWPYLSHNRKDFKRFDVSKLAQWDIIFSHAERLGIVMQLVTQEKENELILDSGNTGQERKLYYRELIARFGHHQNIIWNMGEENGSALFWPQGQSDQQRYAMMRYLKDHDPYKNPLVIHTMSEGEERTPILSKLLRYDKLDGLSMQISHVEDIHHDVKEWIDRSEKNDRQWIVMMDEIGPWHTGTNPDEEDPAHDKLRHQVLWGTLMAGGAGVEWYFGWLKPPNDLNAENWRSRNNIWEQSAIAHEFFKKIPYTEMKSTDSLLMESTNYCFSKPGEIYAVYLKKGKTTSLDLRGQTGTFEVFWYDPKNGGPMQKGTKETLNGGNWEGLGEGPKPENRDWVVLLKRK